MAKRHFDLGVTVEELTNATELRGSYASVDAASLPDEVSAGNDWKDESLCIPDREAYEWEGTDPQSALPRVFITHARRKS